MLPCSRCSLGFESSCEQTGSCLRVLPFITGTSFLQVLPSAVSSAPIPSSVLPICSSSLRRWLCPISVSSSFHAVPCDIISPGQVIPSHPFHLPPISSSASWWSFSRLPLWSRCSFLCTPAVLQVPPRVHTPSIRSSVLITGKPAFSKESLDNIMSL